MSNPIPKSIILPSIFKPLGDEGPDVISETSFTAICDEKECEFREAVKQSYTTICKQYGLSPAMGVFSMVPISMEIALEHINADNFKEAIQDFANIVNTFLHMLQSKSMESTIKSAVESYKNNLDW